MLSNSSFNGKIKTSLTLLCLLIITAQSVYSKVSKISERFAVGRDDSNIFDFGRYQLSQLIFPEASDSDWFVFDSEANEVVNQGQLMDDQDLMKNSLTFDDNKNLWAQTNDGKTLIKFDPLNSVNLTISKRFTVPLKNSNVPCVVITLFYNNLAVVECNTANNAQSYFIFNATTETWAQQSIQASAPFLLVRGGVANNQYIAYSIGITLLEKAYIYVQELDTRKIKKIYYVKHNYNDMNINDDNMVSVIFDQKILTIPIEDPEKYQELDVPDGSLLLYLTPNILYGGFRETVFYIYNPSSKNFEKSWSFRNSVFGSISNFTDTTVTYIQDVCSTTYDINTGKVIDSSILIPDPRAYWNYIPWYYEFEDGSQFQVGNYFVSKNKDGKASDYYSSLINSYDAYTGNDNIVYVMGKRDSNQTLDCSIFSLDMAKGDIDVTELSNCMNQTENPLNVITVSKSSDSFNLIYSHINLKVGIDITIQLFIDNNLYDTHITTAYSNCGGFDYDQSQVVLFHEDQMGEVHKFVYDFFGVWISDEQFGKGKVAPIDETHSLILVHKLLLRLKVYDIKSGEFVHDQIVNPSYKNYDYLIPLGFTYDSKGKVSGGSIIMVESKTQVAHYDMSTKKLEIIYTVSNNKPIYVTKQLGLRFILYESQYKFGTATIYEIDQNSRKVQKLQERTQFLD